MSDFLEESNPCGRTLLTLVSRGNALVAEILRLSDIIPNVFRCDGGLASASKSTDVNYGEIICDFSYFKNQDAFEAKIESNRLLRDKDNELRDNCNLDVLIAFCTAFESVYKYIIDLNSFLADLEDGGVFIQQSIDSVLANQDGKQLMSEALYLVGVLLLVIDQKIEGPIRERMLVSYYRYSAQRSTSDSNFDDLVHLFACTGFSPSTGKKPLFYPEDYFKRVTLNRDYLYLVIGRLRFDDIYNQLSVYPHPEHRSFALTNQASMLYVILYFAPDLLHNEHAIMREIVDKFFSDNFVINIYMGIIVNLIEAWEPFKAAKSALNNTLESVNLKKLSSYHGPLLQRLCQQSEKLLEEGRLNEELVLDSPSKLIKILRECNVTLRWLMLHTFSNVNIESSWITGKRCKQVRDIIVAESHYDASQLFHLLLYTSQLELKVKEIYKLLLNQKVDKWQAFKKESLERITELSEVFSGTKPLTRIKPNSDLQEWFNQLAQQINTLKCEEMINSYKIIVQMIKAIDEVQEFHQLESNLQVIQYLKESRKYLESMLKISSVKEEVLITMQTIGDISYAWLIIDSFTKHMQQGIQEEPTLVNKLRATFLKLASALDMPLIRIKQASSVDYIPVSRYYSNELVSYVRKVLHIIPDSLFRLMSRVIDIQTNEIQELPTRLMKDQIKQYAKLDERLEVAQLTYSIAMFTEGILQMKTTLVGIIKIDPKKLLEDGIRKELVQQVAKALHNDLVFNPKAKSSELIPKLVLVSQKMDGFRRSLDYIQDYVCIYGLKIWQEEVSRIVNYNVEQECNSLMRTKVVDWESVYQSKTVPLPKFSPIDSQSINFIGRLAREILRITDARSTIYIGEMRTWYDYKTHNEIVDPKLFELLIKSLGTAGMNGLDRFFSFMILTEFTTIKTQIEVQIMNEKWWSETLHTLTNFIERNEFDTSNAIQFKSQSPLAGKSNRAVTTIIESLLKIGQMQIIKINLAYELNLECKFQSRNLASAYETLNEVFLAEYKKHPERLFAKDESQLSYELTNYLEWAGISDPLSKIYTTFNSPAFVDWICLILVISLPQKLADAKSFHGLIAKKPTDCLDGSPFVMGLISFLNQFRVDVMRPFLKILSRYIKSTIDSTYQGLNKITEFPQEIRTYLFVMEEIIRLARLPRSLLTEDIPSLVMDQFHSLL